MAPNVKNVVEEPEESWPDHPGASTRFIDLDIRLDSKDYGRRSTSSSHRPKSLNEIRNGNAWGEANALQSNLHIVVGDRSFHLHEFPLISKSGKLNRLVFELRDPGKDRIFLKDVPGGAAAFESAVRCLYGKSSVPLTSANVAPLRCAGEFLEMNDSLGAGSLVAETEHYLNLVVVGSWKESIAVLRSCSDLKPWAEELEIVRRCSESVAWKACTDPHGLRWSYSKSSNARNVGWWFDDVCSLHIDTFTKVINAVIAKGMESTTIAAVVTQYAEKWLNLAKVHDSKSGAQNPPLAGSAQNLRNRGILQGIVSLLPSQPNSLSCKVLLKLLRAACALNAGALCKTDLARRIGAQLEKVAAPGELLIPAYGAASDAMYDIDLVHKIVEYYYQEQSSAERRRQPLSSGSCTTSVSTVTTSSSSSDRSDSGSNATTDSRSSISRSTVSGSETSSSSMSDSSESDESATTGTTSSREPGSVKLEYSRFSTSEEPTRRPQLPPISSNLKVAHLLENVLEEVAKDSSIPVRKFIALADLYVDFPRESDDYIYQAIDSFLRSHASLNDQERRRLCKVMDIQALSLNACMHAASNERLPLRVVVQVLFAEQVKLRNAIMETMVVSDSTTASFSSSTISRYTYSDSCSSTSTATGSSATNSSSSSSLSVHSVAPSAAPSFASSPMPGGLNVKDTLRSALSEIDLLRTAVQEIETMKARLNFMDVLQQEMENINRKFMDLAQDLTHQGEEPTKGSKQKGGWTSGWKKMAKPFHGKDNPDPQKGCNNSLVSEKHLKDTTPMYQQMSILHPTDVPFLQNPKRPVQAKFTAPKAVVVAASRIPEANVEKAIVMPKVEVPAPKPELAIVPPGTQPKAPENGQVNGVTERQHNDGEQGRDNVSKDIEPPRQSASEKNQTLRHRHHHNHGGAHTPSPHGEYSHHGQHSDTVSVSSHYSYSSDHSNPRHRLRNTSSSHHSTEHRSHPSSSHDHKSSSHHRHGSRSRSQSPDIGHRHRRSHHSPDHYRHHHHSKDPPRRSSATKHDHHHHSRDPPRASSATKHGSDHHSDHHHHHHHSRDPPRASSATKHGSEDHHSDHHHHHRSKDPPRASSATKHGSDHHSDHHHHHHSRDDPPRASSAGTHKNGSDHHSAHRSKPHYRSHHKHDHSKDYDSASTYSSDSGPGRAARPRRHSGV